MVRLRLCPFAEGVFTTERGVRYVVTPAENADELWVEFLREVDHLMAHDREVRDIARVLTFRARSGVQPVSVACFCPPWSEVGYNMGFGR